METNLNILVINWQCISNPQGGGAEVHMHEIFKRVAKRGHKVTILASCFPGCKSEEIIDGIRIVRRGSRNLFNFLVPREYKKLAKAEKFDIIIDDINKIPFYTPLYVKEPLLAISHHFFGKSIFREAGFVAGNYVYLGEYLIDKVYKRTPFAVVSDSTLNEFLERGFNRTHFSIVPNAIDSERFAFKVGEKEPSPTIAYFGRLKKYKSVDHLFYAFAKVKKEFPDAKLHILGKGDFMDELKQIAAKLGITDSTTFFGFVSEEDKERLLSRSHIMVNTSMKEGWGITNIEANACGTPVVSADVPGLRDSVKAGVSGELYEYGNIDSLAKILIDILKNENKRIALSEGACQWANSFSWETSAELMIETIRKVIHQYK